MKRAILISALILAACSGEAPPAASTSAAPEAIAQTIQPFTCADGSTIIVAMRENEVQLTFTDGLQQVLPNVVAASGARYEAAGMEFWNKGNEAMFTAPGKPQTTCTAAK